MAQTPNQPAAGRGGELVVLMARTADLVLVSAHLDTTEARTVGISLFDYVFQGDVRSVYRQAGIDPQTGPANPLRGG